MEPVWLNLDLIGLQSALPGHAVGRDDGALIIITIIRSELIILHFHFLCFTRRL